VGRKPVGLDPPQQLKRAGFVSSGGFGHAGVTVGESAGLKRLRFGRLADF
jgi:hypothetical protein